MTARGAEASAGTPPAVCFAASGSDAVVLTVGPSGVDHCYDVDAWPTHGDKSMLRDHRVEYGGMIANAASVLGALGARPHHLERIPSAGSEGVLASLQQHGVETGLVQLSPTAALSTCYVIRAAGERTIFIDVEGREPVEVTDEVRAALASATVILSSPAELRDPGLRAAVLAAVGEGAKLALDVEHCGLENLDEDRELVAAANWVCTNPEALGVLGLRVEAAPAGQELLVTEGSRGSTIHRDGSATRVAAVPVAAVDTTGCSDTYFASYLFARLRGDDLAESGAFAALAAAHAATGLGARSGAVGLDVLRRFADRVALSPARGGQDLREEEPQ